MVKIDFLINNGVFKYLRIIFASEKRLWLTKKKRA
jgi:hypothetical protein